MVEKERQVYNNAVKNARKEMELNHRPAGVIPPCSTDLKEVHYTFDFSQALSIPHHARQEGPLYFLTPRKVQLFGVAIEGHHHQINYLIDEDQGIGENGAGIKGANGVVSMLHHCLTTYGSGEKSCVIHCDNCAGENKNRYVLGYLMWRTLMDLHHDIQLSMQVVRKSARSNSPVTYINDAGEHSWEWYDWKPFTSTFFTNVKGIRKMRHFRFSSLSPGKPFVKSHANDSEREITLLKSSISPEDITTGSVMPDILPPGGMTSERQRYLFRVVRPFIAILGTNTEGLSSGTVKDGDSEKQAPPTGDKEGVATTPGENSSVNPTAKRGRGGIQTNRGQKGRRGRK
uniref:Uncharacterized protein n=1 Tax=Magallana gigas TaxID=29159 RepID=A0A8W8LA80_MAGGI